MNREIKFRAWNENEMIYPSLDGHGKLTSGWLLNNYSIIMQYTGLKDKNGKDIYEGDIIYVEEYYEKRNGIIVPDLERTGFKIEWCAKTEFNEYIHVRIKEIEVIGNIYQNPELLNK